MSTDEAQAYIDRCTTLRKNVQAELSKVIIGYNEVIDNLLLSLLCGGNLIIEGVPGLAKTLLVKALAKCFDFSFSRIQFTPDLMPSDILGSEILQDNNGKREFTYFKGPIFANLILADEINRTPPRTQSALLEAMQEKRVTIYGKTYEIEEPFFVFATQNPIEQEGTYHLPEAQLDRFLFRIILNYPSFEEELSIASSYDGGKDPVQNLVPQISKDDFLSLKNIIPQIPITESILKYAVNLVSQTRPETTTIKEIKDFISFGAGPRASQQIVFAAKAHAILHGKPLVDKEDIKAVCFNVLNHRLIVSYRSFTEGVTVKDIVDKLFAKVA